MSVAVEIQGMKELQRALMGLPDKIKAKEIKSVLRKSTSTTIKAARALAPKSSKPHHRYSGGKIVATYQPGNLAKSIGNITSRSKQPTILVGPRAGKNRKYDGFYGNFIEYGTVHTPAQPFMRPAFQQTKGQAGPEAAKRISQHIQKRINQLSK